MSDERNNNSESTSRRLLVADDDESTAKRLQQLLATDGVTVEIATDGRKALQLLVDASRPFSLFLTDLKMPGMDGLQLIEEIRKHDIPVSVIVMTGFGSVEEAVRAMRLGAIDFLTKPIDPDHLQLVVERALRERSLQDEILQLQQQLEKRYSFQNIISKSPRMHAIFELINNVAETNSTVLIEGPTGTGKELIAQAIHHVSSRNRSGPFVPVNCVALPETLLESELFGHEKGAFTGAVRQHIGRFEMAHRGTLFLDEISEVPAPLQAKLLRVLQDRRFERIGGSQSIEVDIRLIAATNRRLARLIKKGSFREDLYYRINVVRIELPPLRERAEDIPLLASHFAEKYTPDGHSKSIAPDAMEVLMNHRWPGNVRELENVIERACVICRHDIIDESHLPPEITGESSMQAPLRVDLSRPLPELIEKVTESFEKRYIEAALAKTGGNVTRCTKICGLSRRSLSSKISEYGIDKAKAKRSTQED